MSLTEWTNSWPTRLADRLPEELKLHIEPFEIIAAGDPNSGFARWVETLEPAGVEAKQIAIAEYDREHGYNPIPHPRGKEVYVLVPAERLEEALKILTPTSWYGLRF